jgi:hypothetical protein
MQNTENDRDAFFAQYVNTLLWSEMDDSGEPLDETYDADDVAPESITEMRKECDDFVNANENDLTDVQAEQAGHDFALTRNRHGAGFWDRGVGALGDRLSEAAKVYGTQGLYVGDDGTLYAQG